MGHDDLPDTGITRTGRAIGGRHPLSSGGRSARGCPDPRGSGYRLGTDEYPTNGQRNCYSPSINRQSTFRSPIASLASFGVDTARPDWYALERSEKMNLDQSAA